MWEVSQTAGVVNTEASRVRVQLPEGLTKKGEGCVCPFCTVVESFNGSGVAVIASLVLRFLLFKFVTLFKRLNG